MHQCTLNLLALCPMSDVGRGKVTEVVSGIVKDAQQGVRAREAGPSR